MALPTAMVLPFYCEILSCLYISTEWCLFFGFNLHFNNMFVDIGPKFHTIPSLPHPVTLALFLVFSLTRLLSCFFPVKGLYI